MYSLFSIIVFILIVYFCIKLSLKLKVHKQVILKHGVSGFNLMFLQLSCYFYMAAAAGFALPFAWLDGLRPMPAGFILLFPGIILGNNIASTLNKTGINKASDAGHIARQVSYVGIGSAIIFSIYIVLSLA